MLYSLPHCVAENIDSFLDPTATVEVASTSVAANGLYGPIANCRKVCFLLDLLKETVKNIVFWLNEFVIPGVEEGLPQYSHTF